MMTSASSPHTDKNKRALPRWLGTTIVAVLAFVAGLAIQQVRILQLGNRHEHAERALVLSRLQATLGAATIEAQLGSYETSRRLASDFFTELQASSESLPPAGREDLARLLTQRDATITMLSRQDPEAGAVLSRMFGAFRVTTSQLADSTVP